jgi:antitoxin YefM
MCVAATPVSLSEAKARLSELARRVRQQRERIMLTRNGEPEAVLLSVDDLEGLEATLEILGDSGAGARISESLAALGRGEPGADLAAFATTWSGAATLMRDNRTEQRYEIRFQPAAR